MKPKHVQAERLNARAVLSGCRIALGADFHSLSTDQLLALGDEADRVRYQRPARACGSRLRYFHDLLQRRAR